MGVATVTTTTSVRYKTPPAVLAVPMTSTLVGQVDSMHQVRAMHLASIGNTPNATVLRPSGADIMPKTSRVDMTAVAAG